MKSFDLHGYSLDEANNKINDLIKDSYEKGVKKLIIVKLNIILGTAVLAITLPFLVKGGNLFGITRVA